MAKIKIVQVKSKIGTLQALGLRKTNGSIEVEATPQIRGMVEKVRHLIKVTEL
jgi:large subunit ribosomal protein L30